MKFLFWNINKNNNIYDKIACLAVSEEIDVLMLAEFNGDPDELLLELNEDNTRYAYLPNGLYDKIHVFVTSPKLISTIYDAPRYTVKSIISPIIGDSINLVILHYQSKRNWSKDDQSAHISEDIKPAIKEIEDTQGHKRTIVCGDFNMNPFEDSLVQHSGFHAVMEKEIAQKQTRTVSGKEYHFFYNPMWGFLGDLGRGKVSGTMYYSPANPIVYHWNLYDQVLIRPDLIDYFNDEGLDIVTQIGSTNLLTQKKLIDTNISDHLPIKFELNI
ncbi:hypothetical protein EZS27_007803 [termite gut metagenome]|uniref:Endonuclease/exonuclease/phosphatase domain-containing protein n=1 Tax=termite gut metagenome TaxID=433724 RepID=A0A5J4SEI4_9ZZZZ